MMMWGSGVTAAMVAIEFLEVSLSTTLKAALKKGMSQFVYSFYGNLLGIFVLLFSCLIFYRKRSYPPLCWTIICRIFLLSFVSCCVQIFLNTGISYSSPTLSTAMVDLTPALTFLLAIIFRMEKLVIKFHSSQAKVAGTILSIGGALIVTLFKGPSISGFLSQSDKLLMLPSNWVIGGIFCAIGATCLSIMFIVQTWIIKDYQAELIVNLINSIFVSLLSGIVALIAERDQNAWTLKSDMKLQLIAILWTGLYSALRNVVHTWACRRKGPVYTAMFKPLGMVIAVVLGVAFLGDDLYIGSGFGAIIIALGFYAMMWGKVREDQKMAMDTANSELDHSSSPQAPLLQDFKIIHV